MELVIIGISRRIRFFLKILLEKLPKINLCRESPAGFSVVGLTVVIFGVVGLGLVVVGLGFGVVASKSIIEMIFFSTLHVYCNLKYVYF